MITEVHKNNIEKKLFFTEVGGHKPKQNNRQEAARNKN